ncbi:SDR family NAD(P)-dependent oxidoreductase [Sphingomonas zeae]
MSGSWTIVTGANRGLGLHLARLLASAGHDLVLVGRTPADPGLGRTGSGSTRLLQVSCDLRDPRSLATALAPHLDGQAVGLLINNAGVFSQAEEHGLSEMEPAAIVDMMLVNAVAPAILSRAVLERPGPGSLIVNILSDMAFPCDWDGTYPAYRASKALLWSLTVNMEAEAARQGGKVIGVDPGWMWTDMGGPEAPDDPALIAAGIVALCERRTELRGGKVYRASDGAVIEGWADGEVI